MAGDNKNIKISIGQMDIANVSKEFDTLKSKIREFSDDSIKSFEKLSDVTNKTLETLKALSGTSGSLSTVKPGKDFTFTPYVDQSKSSAFLQRVSEENKNQYKSSSVLSDKNITDLGKVIQDLSGEVKNLSTAISGGAGGQGGGGGRRGGGPPSGGGDGGSGDGGDGFFRRSSKIVSDYLSGKHGGTLGEVGGIIGKIIGPEGISFASRAAGPLMYAQLAVRGSHFLGQNFGDLSMQQYEIERRRVQNQAFYEGQQGDFFRQMLRDTGSGFTERKLRGEAGVYETFKDVLSSPQDLWNAFRTKTSFSEAREKRVREETEGFALEYSADIRKALQRSFERKMNSFDAQLAIGVGATESSYENLARGGLSNAEANFFVREFARARGAAATRDDLRLAKSGLQYGFSESLIGSLVRSGGGRATGNEAFDQYASVLLSAGLGDARYQDARGLVGGEISRILELSGGMLSVGNIGGTVSASAKAGIDFAIQRGAQTPMEMQEATRQGLSGMRSFMQQSKDPRSFINQTQMSVLMGMGLNPIEAMRAMQLGLNRADVIKGITDIASKRTGKQFQASYLQSEVSQRLSAAAGLTESMFGKDFLSMQLEGLEGAGRMANPAARALLSASAISTGKVDVMTEEQLKKLQASDTTRNFFNENTARHDSEQNKAVKSLPETLEQSITKSFDRGISELAKAIMNFIDQTPRGQEMDSKLWAINNKIESLEFNKRQYGSIGKLGEAELQQLRGERENLEYKKQQISQGETPAAVEIRRGLK